jgi:hypothetical protein
VQDHCTQGSGQTPTLGWQVVNATGVALSVDNPGMVGSAGTYVSPIGTRELPFIACVGDPGTVITHRYDVYTVGGTGGQQAKRTINVSITVDARPQSASPPSVRGAVPSAVTHRSALGLTLGGGMGIEFPAPPRPKVNAHRAEADRARRAQR